LKNENKKHKMENNKKKRFIVGLVLIQWCGFHQNNNVLLQQHWLQGLQIGLPS
jgi:hypothetical protein